MSDTPCERGWAQEPLGAGHTKHTAKVGNDGPYDKGEWARLRGLPIDRGIDI